MKTVFAIIFVLGVLGFQGIDFAIPSAEMHSIKSTLTPPIITIGDETFDQQFLQTGETLTVRGVLINSNNQETRGWLSFFLESSDTSNRWEMLAREPLDVVFNIPGNSVIEYSLSAKALEAGTYHMHTQFNIDKIGPEFGPGQTIIVEGNSITKPIAFTNTAYELIPVVIGGIMVIGIMFYFLRKRK